MENTVFDEARIDWRTAQCVDTGVKVSLADGVTPALEFMLDCGVPRQVAMRVLTDPQFGRNAHCGVAANGASLRFYKSS